MLEVYIASRSKSPEKMIDLFKLILYTNYINEHFKKFMEKQFRAESILVQKRFEIRALVFHED